jgi:hypothetical protein
MAFWEIFASIKNEIHSFFYYLKSVNHF